MFLSEPMILVQTDAYVLGLLMSLTLSPLSYHSMWSPDPELPNTALFLTVCFLNFQADISALAL